MLLGVLAALSTSIMFDASLLRTSCGRLFALTIPDQSFIFESLRSLVSGLYHFGRVHWNSFTVDRLLSNQNSISQILDRMDHGAEYEPGVTPARRKPRIT